MNVYYDACRSTCKLRETVCVRGTFEIAACLRDAIRCRKMALLALSSRLTTKPRGEHMFAPPSWNRGSRGQHSFYSAPLGA